MHSNTITNSNTNSELLDEKFQGYLEIPKFKLKRLITTGETKKVLDMNYVLYYNSFYSLDKNNSNIVLLGHNVDSVFRFLHYLDIGDEIILVTHEACYYFTISKIFVVSEKSTDVLNKKFDSKTLTLITCMKNNKNRLILLANLKKVS